MKTQKELIEEFLAQKFKISIKHATPADKFAFGQQVNRLVCNFKYILRNLRSSKKTSILRNIVFISTAECVLLRDLAKQSIYMNETCLDDGNENVLDDDATVDEKEN